jgi:hypothetical protein
MDITKQLAIHSTAVRELNLIEIDSLCNHDYLLSPSQNIKIGRLGQRFLSLELYCL